MPGILLGLSTEYEQNALSPRNGITVGDITISIRMSVHCQTNESIYVSWKGLCGERRAECKRKQQKGPPGRADQELPWDWSDLPEAGGMMRREGRRFLQGQGVCVHKPAGENTLGPPLRPVGLEFTGKRRGGGWAGPGRARHLKESAFKDLVLPVSFLAPSGCLPHSWHQENTCLIQQIQWKPVAT